MKEGGVMDQVTHELQIEALPTAIPDYITVDVSGMEIAATMHLSELTAPEGVAFLDDLEETIVATVVVPTEVEEPDEIEEETELVGEEGEAAEAEEPDEAGGDEGPAATPRRARTPEPVPPPLRRWRGWGRQGRLAGGRPGQPGRSLRAHPPQHRLRGGQRWPPSAGACRRPGRATPGCTPTAAPGRAALAWGSCSRRRT